MSYFSLWTKRFLIKIVLKEIINTIMFFFFDKKFFLGLTSPEKLTFLLEEIYMFLQNLTFLQKKNTFFKRSRRAPHRKKTKNHVLCPEIKQRHSHANRAQSNFLIKKIEKMILCKSEILFRNPSSNCKNHKILYRRWK